MLLDQLVENVVSHRIKEKLLLETDLTLSKAITIATQIEAAGEQVKTISDQKFVPVQAIQRKSMSAGGQYKTQYFVKPSVSSKTFKSSKGSKMTSSVRACYRCGSTKHLANDSRCPAASEKCHNSQMIGHFSRVCCSQQTRSVHEIELPELKILYMQNGLTDKIKCTATIMTSSASVPVELIIDSGSSVSILPKSVYETYFKKDSLLPPSVKLVTYSCDLLPVLGCLPVTVTKNDVNCST